MERSTEENLEKHKDIEELTNNYLAPQKPSYRLDEEWVKQYIKDFGTEPSFF